MIPGLLVALILHEVAHGYVAYLLGDPTAKAQGRLTRITSYNVCYTKLLRAGNHLAQRSVRQGR